MKITEWFARAVAAGLMPDWKNIYVKRNHEDSIMFYNNINCDEEIMLNYDSNIYVEDCQLRKDGKDLFKLEWRKPTEHDVRKMCWFIDGDNIILAELKNILNDRMHKYRTNFDGFVYCILADHGQIAPTKEDFERVYHDC